MKIINKNNELSESDREFLQYLMSRRLDRTIPEKNKILINEQIRVFCEEHPMNYKVDKIIIKGEINND